LKIHNLVKIIKNKWISIIIIKNLRMYINKKQIFHWTVLQQQSFFFNSWFYIINLFFYKLHWASYSLIVFFFFVFWKITLYILNFNNFITLYILLKKFNKKYQNLYKIAIIFYLITKEPLEYWYYNSTIKLKKP
jgi:hypothetical protein